MTRIACVGEAMIELSILGQTSQVGVAGDTLNTAIYLKRNAPQFSVDYVTCLGDDPFSDQIEDFIAAQAIGTGAVTRLTGKSPGLYAITTTEDGERSFTYWRSAAAARDLFQTGAGYDFAILEAYDLVYLSGISVAILPDAARSALVEWLGRTPIKLAYDSNYRPRLWEDKPTAQRVTSALWERADICLPSIDDEMLLFDEDAAAVEARFTRYHGTGALKRGADGPISLGDAVSQAYGAAPHVLDTTAAGDSFNGAYLAALLAGGSQAQALRAGHDCAAQVVQYRGAIIPKAAP
ncbi:sugar kinase [Roseobacter denitrificans]|uniref:2-dehydro-3-deoxygluconokinase n=1 Tax=Roseobacter denitrificans (strain ATCC 33942 / OCh 114) TaxID=375451 RepID=Q16CC6_ROSDO|nr:sugar kinase [Roseobacter denitrificans]ABG30367.1 2-dehydro-3-deoxygluconokinase [Roseobacter denitrificans OCh 114]AVL53528.1 sugar kinase [Roseobacter denitrificans]SFF72017.1 2-dehydro-3-deoxygluconokinase [Roseobacter denitrificans OCh 114]